jgi:hypothetical protein
MEQMLDHMAEGAECDDAERYFSTRYQVGGGGMSEECPDDVSLEHLRFCDSVWEDPPSPSQSSNSLKRTRSRSLDPASSWGDDDISLGFSENKMFDAGSSSYVAEGTGRKWRGDASGDMIDDRDSRDSCRLKVNRLHRPQTGYVEEDRVELHRMRKVESERARDKDRFQIGKDVRSTGREMDVGDEEEDLIPLWLKNAHEQDEMHVDRVSDSDPIETPSTKRMKENEKVEVSYCQNLFFPSSKISSFYSRKKNCLNYLFSSHSPSTLDRAGG